MKTKTLSASLLALMIAAVSLASTAEATRTPGCKFDKKTGQWVCGPVISGGTGPFNPGPGTLPQ